MRLNTVTSIHWLLSELLKDLYSVKLIIAFECMLLLESLLYIEVVLEWPQWDALLRVYLFVDIVLLLPQYLIDLIFINVLLLYLGLLKQVRLLLLGLLVDLKLVVLG
ncbi:MAG: hypothetical protein ACMG6E_09655, partial [Candidatus Roizmanbacteria bacterium]